jgi:hypothetical protein
MAKNAIATPYDDAGFPALANATVSIPFGGGLVKASAGRLLKVIITTAFVTAGTLTLYDNASAASGTILLAIPQGAGTSSQGVIYTLDLPAVNGIFAGSSGITAGAVTVGYA